MLLRRAVAKTLLGLFTCAAVASAVAGVAEGYRRGQAGHAAGGLIVAAFASVVAVFCLAFLVWTAELEEPVPFWKAFLYAAGGWLAVLLYAAAIALPLGATGIKDLPLWPFFAASPVLYYIAGRVRRRVRIAVWYAFSRPTPPKDGELVRYRPRGSVAPRRPPR